ncbi:hypothetical protein A1Q2_03146 [Trichosporon asahii var. asahii CBS 8904]|uniref:ER membrane protein complex subunit 3 n=1 Tax=Trichosporon asahii var. asahii (strain CBS 8904) TaxID=1220162 RepID=K1VEV2_TRIAC|nr:hypothetical protein A1Q2_03146 [Trichosporon asahii var. asahii CBS 8904]
MLLNSPPKKQPVAAVREQRCLMRSQLLRASAPLSPLDPALFRSFVTSNGQALTSGEYLRPKPKDQEQQMPFGDPTQMDGMMDGMKKQAVMITSTCSSADTSSSLFARDLPLPDLSMQWVSALSWYFLNLFGLNGVFKLLIGQDNAATDKGDMSAMAMMGGAGAAPMTGPAAPDFEKIYRSELENLALTEELYNWVATGVEDRVLQRYAKA